MLVPVVATRVEEHRHGIVQRIDPGQIWPLVQVAAVAGEGEVVDVGRAAVLLRSNVFDMKHRVNAELGQMAILATVRGAFANELPECDFIHDLGVASVERAFDFKMPTKSSVSISSS